MENIMPTYMTQKMSSGTKKAVTYYRKQSQDHVDHAESGKFTADAKSRYASDYEVDESAVEVGTYKSGQGIPTGGETVEI